VIIKWKEQGKKDENSVRGAEKKRSLQEERQR
jgi:hypothetical protein